MLSGYRCRLSAIIGGRNPAAITQQQGLARTDNLFEGLKLLEMIARRKSLRIRTTQQEAELTLGLLCFANLHFDGKQMASRSVSKVVTMVAAITPVVVFGLMMPSRVKVLEGRGPTAATRKLLEIARTSTGELFVQDAFLLSRELKQISRPSRTLRKFIGELEMTSPAYWAMNQVLEPT